MQRVCQKCGKTHEPPRYLERRNVCLSCKVAENAAWRLRTQPPPAPKPPRLADLAVWECRHCGAKFSPSAWKRRRSDRSCPSCTQVARERWVERTGWTPPAYTLDPARRRATYIKASAKYYADPEKRVRSLARARARYLIKRGVLIRRPCEVCGSLSVEAHHDDYATSDVVRWLCRPHHREHHVAERALARLAA